MVGFATIARLAGPKIWLVVGIGAVAEIVGLYTGIPFGHYDYTSAWWPTVGLPAGERFPLQLPFAWGMIAGAAALFCWRRPFWIAGLAAAIIDLVMEPVMVGKLGYWKWAGSGVLPGGAPILNFIGWFAISCCAAWILGTSRERSNEPGIVLAGHLVLLIAIALR